MRLFTDPYEVPIGLSEIHHTGSDEVLNKILVGFIQVLTLFMIVPRFYLRFSTFEVLLGYYCDSCEALYFTEVLVGFNVMFY